MSEIINGGVIQVIQQISDIIKSAGPSAFFVYIVHLIFGFLPKLLLFVGTLISIKWIINLFKRLSNPEIEDKVNEVYSNMTFYNKGQRHISEEVESLRKLMDAYIKFSPNIPAFEQEIKSIREEFNCLKEQKLEIIDKNINNLKNEIGDLSKEGCGCGCIKNIKGEE